ncbi:MAG: MinD/ParA family protein [Actinomycetota bacterium]|nr:MinD/ParA family protein [Actinomycetota bacterium]
MRDWERFSWDQEADVQPVPLGRAGKARRPTAAEEAAPSPALESEESLDDDARTGRAAEFTDEYMLRPRSLRPSRGWRRAVYRATGGTINLGPSEAELRERDLVARVKNPVFGCRRIAVISRKGGVGKTTTTLNLGHTFAAHRGDRVVALDGNPDAGSLGYRVRRQTAATVTDLLRDSHVIDRYSDVRAYTSQAPTRLEVVASNDDPRITQALGRDDYKRISEILERHYNLILLDTGTGILDSATRGILDLADQVVVVMAPSLDGARAASLTLDWLEEHDYGDLVDGAVAVVNGVRSRDGLVELDRVEEHFEGRCATVVRIPWDPHLEAGAETMPEDLKRGTREAYLELAAAVAGGFGPS